MSHRQLSEWVSGRERELLARSGCSLASNNVTFIPVIPRTGWEFLHDPHWYTSPPPLFFPSFFWCVCVCVCACVCVFWFVCRFVCRFVCLKMSNLTLAFRKQASKYDTMHPFYLARLRVDTPRGVLRSGQKQAIQRREWQISTVKWGKGWSP